MNPTEPNPIFWRLPELPSTSFDPPTQSFSSEDSTVGQLSVGCTFRSKNDMEDAVGAYHMDNKVAYRVQRSNKGRWYLMCKDDSSCPFTLHATFQHDVWRVIKLTIPHTCSNNVGYKEPNKMSSKILGRIFSKKYVGRNMEKTPKQIQENLIINHGLHVNYKLARMVKGHAISMLYGDGDSSFSKLPGYLYQLEMANRGSYTSLLKDKNDVFKYVFFALGASISGFTRYGRPTWFLRCLREAFGCPRDLVFVSDQHASIIHSVAVVYPEATHCLCYYHLKEKIVNYGNHVVTRFYDASFTCNKLEYSRCIETLRGADLSGRLMDKLLTADPARWARSCCPVPRYEFMTSNTAETWNNKLVWARKLPVVSMLECIRTIIETWFVERRNAALAHNGELCEEVSKKIAEVRKEASKLIVTSLGDERYKVSFLSVLYVVNLDVKVCDCGEFQCLGIPCIHAAAAIRFGGHDICSFVHPGYSSRNVQGMWRGSIEPVPHPNQWANFAHLNSIKCYPPKQPRQAGRPRVSRRRSGLETSTSTRKSRINETEPIGLSQESASVVNQTQQIPRRRGVRKCSTCGENGHTKRTCPNQNN
ncbi:hypothetical protein ACS0TY_005256 [Phlomoides rotata]